MIRCAAVRASLTGRVASEPLAHTACTQPFSPASGSVVRRASSERPARSSGVCPLDWSHRGCWPAGVGGSFDGARAVVGTREFASSPGRVMHTILAYTNLFRHHAVLGQWISEAVGRGERVLFKHAPREDADTDDGLRRSLASLGLDPASAAAGQVELVDCADVCPVRWPSQGPARSAYQRGAPGSARRFQWLGSNGMALAARLR
jgi:hypothetical protein